jgi:hypothetical protein
VVYLAKVYKPKVIKGLKVKYDDKEYDKITSISRGYDYSSFTYVDENGSECSVYLSVGKSFITIES